MQQALERAQRFPELNVQRLTTPSFRDLLVEAVDTRENMECTDADGDEVPDLISSVSARVVEIEMENIEEPENLAEYQRLD